MNSHPRNFLLRILKKEPVLAVSAVCMLFSMLFVPPTAAYADYIDFRVLALLFCLMAVVAGLQRCNFFTRMAQLLLTGKKRRRPLFLTLILLPFFVSMLVTNDVALITFVPFAILILELTGQQKYLVFIVVMQTVAANLGSMATPVGNPQNLYLYSRFGLSAGSFFKTVLPFALLALILTAASVLFCPDREFIISFPGMDETRPSSEPFPEKKRLLLYLCLFALCLLSVFHLLPYPILFFIVCTALLFAGYAACTGCWITACWLPLSAFLSSQEISEPSLLSEAFCRSFSLPGRSSPPRSPARSSATYPPPSFCPASRTTGGRCSSAPTSAASGRPSPPLPA